MRIKGAHSAQKSKRQDRAHHIGKVGLYLITPPILPDNFTDILKAVLEAGDIACLQLRLKPKANYLQKENHVQGANRVQAASDRISDATILRAADELMPITQAQGVAFLINDRPALFG